MMVNKKEPYFKDLAEDFGKFKEMLDRYDYEHREEIAFEHGIEIGRQLGISIGREQAISIEIEQGISIGKTQMEKEMNRKNVMRMYNMGYALEVIADCLSLDVSVVEDIVKG